MDFWSAPWWAGVQGVTSVVGVLAILIAVLDFVARKNSEPIDAMKFNITRTGEMIWDQRDPYVEVTVTARPMGTHVIYEPEWRVWGLDVWTAPELPGILDARSEPVTLELRVPRDRLAHVQVGLQWVVPRRLSPYTGASRITKLRDGRYERWIPYRWRFWPRKAVGRWVGSKSSTKRKTLHSPD